MKASRDQPQQFELIAGKNDFQRNTRAGMVVPASPTNLSQSDVEITPKLSEIIQETKKNTSRHTQRIMECLQTCLISFFKCPLGTTIDIEKPDHEMVIDLDTLSLIPKPKTVKGWSDHGWAFRWSSEALLHLMPEYKNRRYINLTEEFYNLLNNISHVWISSDSEGVNNCASIIDIFISSNTPLTNPKLDASYFGINSVWIKNLLESPRAAMIYNRQITAQIRSDVAATLALHIMSNLDFNSNCTPMQPRKSWLDMLYGGGDPNKIRWKDFVKTYIKNHIPTIQQALRLNSLEFVTNKRRGDQLFAWFAYDIDPHHPPHISAEAQVPQINAPELVNSWSITNISVQALGRKKQEWADVVKSEVFRQEILSLLKELSLGASVYEAVLERYKEEKNPAEQKPKSVKQWRRPIGQWLARRVKDFHLKLSTETLESDDLIPFDREDVATCKSDVFAGKPSPVKPRYFTIEELGISSDWEQNIVQKLVERFPRLFTENLDPVSFFIQSSNSFLKHHIVNSAEQKKLPNKWFRMLEGYVMNGAGNPTVVKKFQSTPFSIRMLTECEPFCLTLSDIQQKDAGTYSLVFFALEHFSLYYEDKRMTRKAWQKKAWAWLLADRTLEDCRHLLPLY